MASKPFVVKNGFQFPVNAAANKVLVSDTSGNASWAASAPSASAVPWSGVTDKPTTLSGYGITDALMLGSTEGVANGTASAGSATTAAKSDHVHPFQTSVSGNAGTATKLADARSISITGDATWTIASFDGSADVTADLTLVDVATAGTYRSVTVNAKGLVTAGTNPTTLSGYGITDAALLESPALTGTPTAPTAATGTNTAQIATTAFVHATVGGYLAKSVTGGAVALTNAEASVPVIVFTGTLTSNASVAVPATTKRVWTVVNNTTGAFTLTVKTPDGSGVAVSQGKRALVYNDGANVYDGLGSIALSGTPTAPTAVAGTNTTQIATTAFVTSAISAVTSGSLSVTSDLTVGGNLIVNGTTTTVNSTTMMVDDPIITLGGDAAPTSDDNKDRGVEFRWHNGTAAKLGFFGFDDSEGKFTFIPDATNSSEVFTGAAGTIIANLEGSVTGSIGTTTSTTTTGQVLDAFSATAYRSAKFFVQGSSGTSHHATEVIVIHDGTTVQMLEYGTLTTGSSLFTLDADISDGNVRLLVSPGSTDMTFRAARTALMV